MLKVRDQDKDDPTTKLIQFGKEQTHIPREQEFNSYKHSLNRGLGLKHHYPLF